MCVRAGRLLRSRRRQRRCTREVVAYPMACGLHQRGTAGRADETKASCKIGDAVLIRDGWYMRDGNRIVQRMVRAEASGLCYRSEACGLAT